VRRVSTVAATDPDELLIIASDAFDIGLLESVDKVAQQRGQSWTAVWFDLERGWFGPHFVPGESPSVGDLLSRWLAAAREPAVVSAARDAVLGQSLTVPDTELVWVATVFVLPYPVVLVPLASGQPISMIIVSPTLR